MFLLFVQFHELTHQVQKNNVAKQKFNINAVPCEINSLLRDVYDDYFSKFYGSKDPRNFEGNRGYSGVRFGVYDAKSQRCAVRAFRGKGQRKLAFGGIVLSGSGKSGGGFEERNPLYQLCRADVIGDRESGNRCGNKVYRLADVGREERERHRMGRDCT